MYKVYALERCPKNNFGFTIDGNMTKGLYIRWLRSGAPAFNAGMKTGGYLQ